MGVDPEALVTFRDSPSEPACYGYIIHILRSN